MKKRVGTKIYDTDTAVLMDTLDGGIQVYRKKNSPQYFIYNPNGKTKAEMFFELSPDDIDKYLVTPDITQTKVKESNATVRFSPYDRDRIKRLASKQGMSMSQFILMLIDRYETEQNDRGN